MKLPKIDVNPKTIRDVKKSGELEWIITNGTGCYSSSTVTGMNTRKYHGLLIASRNPPLERKVVLSKLEEEVVFGSQKFDLSTNQYLNTVHPKGYENQVVFSVNPFPEFGFSVRGIDIKKTVFLVHKKNILVVKYKTHNPKKLLFKLKISPLVNYRSIYELKKDKEEFNVYSAEKKVIVNFNENEFLTIKGEDFKESDLSQYERWHKNFYYKKENDRGEDSIENNYCPGFFEFETKKKNDEFYLVCGFCESEADFKHPKKLINNEVKRKEKLLKLFFGKNKVLNEEWIKWLVISLDGHIVNDNSIIAGYHWFVDWGRDSMISIPGLLKMGRENEAKDIIRFFGNHIRNGLVPNMMPRKLDEEAIFNTVDASLWFIDRVYKCFLKTKDRDFLEGMKPAMVEIIESYMNGTDFEIKMDDDGLIRHGPGLTWMDARVGDGYVTPRAGKAVEIQGLWYNALMIMNEVFGERKYLSLAKKVKKSFNGEFWNGEYLDDVLGDGKLRPNQLLILDLPFCIVSNARKKRILRVIEKELLTNSGLLTLAEDNPGYKGKYEGYVESRDGAYHQGTIWPWLMGAYIRLSGNQDFLRLFVKKEMNQFGLGTIGEIFDGDEPHKPRGCISQAWSLAEILASV